MKDNEKLLKLISNEILKGAKMLSKHCPKCGYPLLEKDGKIYCVICEKLRNEEKVEEIKKSEKVEEKTYLNGEIKENNINNIISEKINYLADKLKEEIEINRIKEIGEALYILIKIKKKLVEK
ncbi:Sjogren's syndrome/scleroderma autoantigen 1 family protein [Methanocaldococcus sp. 16A]